MSNRCYKGDDMKFEDSFDVVIVGAGPAGLKCGLELAKKNIRVLIVDRKQQIGTPKRCGEGLSERWFKYLEDIPKTGDWIKQKITGVYLFSPSKKMLKIDTESIGRIGYIIERQQFEKRLAEAAIKYGAKIMLRTNVTNLIIENGYVRGIVAKYFDEEIKIKSKIVIAADGVDSRIPRMAGINTAMNPYEFASSFQYEMVNVELYDPNYIEIYFSSKYAPGGYVWIFPKGKGIANVGLGVRNAERSAKEYLDMFILDNIDRFKNSSPIEINAGVVPVTKPIDKLVTNGLIVIGDSARMAHPLHGGGIGISLEAATIASDIVKEAINMNDFSERFLKSFEIKWYEIRGKELLKAYKFRRFLEKLRDEHLDILADIFIDDPNLIIDITHGKKFEAFLKILMKKAPKLLKLAMAVLK